MSHSSSHSSTCDSKDSSALIGKKYKRISAEKRAQLLEKIFFENKKIKKVRIFKIFIQF